jgi:uncharacterized protein YbjQ (UPF0145 family)
MLITTTPNIEGKRVKEYLGIVTGEAVVGDSVSLFLVIVDNKREFRFILSGVLVGGGVAKRQ